MADHPDAPDLDDESIWDPARAENGPYSTGSRMLALRVTAEQMQAIDAARRPGEQRTAFVRRALAAEVARTHQALMSEPVPH